MAEPPPRGLPDEEIHDRLARLDALLGRLERATGPVADAAGEALELLTSVYGTALGRVLALTGPEVAASLLRDELLDHLLALHGLHPRPAEERLRRALEDLRARLSARGGDVELLGVDDGVARLSWSGCGHGCGRSAAAIEQVIVDDVLAAAPELRGVELVPAPDGRGTPALIPVESLLRRPPAPAGSRGGTG